MWYREDWLRRWFLPLLRNRRCLAVRIRRAVRKTAALWRIVVGYQFPPDIQQVVGSRMASGEYGSEDDLLRHALRALEQQEEDLAAVKEAVAEWRAGDEGVPLDEAFASLRTKHRLP